MLDSQILDSTPFATLDYDSVFGLKACYPDGSESILLEPVYDRDSILDLSSETMELETDREWILFLIFKA